MHVVASHCQLVAWHEKRVPFFCHSKVNVFADVFEMFSSEEWLSVLPYFRWMVLLIIEGLLNSNRNSCGPVLHKLKV